MRPENSTSQYWLLMVSVSRQRATGARPTNDISIEFEIQPKFAVLWF